MRRLILSILLLSCVALLCAPGAHAGSIVLTGHDDDYHCSYDPNACAQLGAFVNYVTNGSSLPVLTFDPGSELTSSLAGLGIAYTNVNPNVTGAVTASLFNPSMYSAFIVSSDYTCGGCDNDPSGEAAIAAQSTAIDSFLNAGGGIIGLAGANSASYYSFVPQTATSVGGAPEYGYTQTAVGATLDIPAVNGDQTHNLFYNPGLEGESSLYQIAELNETTGNGVIMPPAAVTLVCTDCTVSGGVLVGPPSITPEPSSILLLASGLGGLAIVVKRRIGRDLA